MLVNMLSERVEIEETVDQLGLLIDAKEWQELQEVLSETVEMDYRSLFGGEIEQLPRAEVISRWKTLLSPLKATQHVITNLHINVKPDQAADCAANVVATHVRPNSLGEPLWTIGGRYDFRLVHEGGRWKISAIKLTVQWTTGNPQVLSPAPNPQS